MGNKVKEVRLRQGVSQKELATQVHVSRQTIHAIESDIFVPSVEVALRIAKVLDLPVEKLFWTKGKTTKQ